MFIARLIFSFISSLIALYAAEYFIPGFNIAGNLQDYAIAAGILAALNVFIRPIIRTVMTPIIFLTFGLGIIAVNMIILKLLDFLSSRITIDGLLPLFWAALLIGIINFIIHLAGKGTWGSK